MKKRETTIQYELIRKCLWSANGNWEINLFITEFASYMIYQLSTAWILEKKKQLCIFYPFFFSFFFWTRLQHYPMISHIPFVNSE